MSAWYEIQAEAHCREAGRLLELVAVAEPELIREAGIAFRVAQRIRSRRLEASR